MACPVCTMPLTDENQIKVPCGCVQCSDCLVSWIATQTKELHYQSEQKVRCLNSHLFKIQTITSNLSLEHQETINDALFDVYLKKTADIRKCPNTNCSYAGVISSTAPCKDKLECKSCGNKWREKIHMSTKEKVTGLFWENTKRSEVLCNLWEEIFTRRCPSCSVRIQKSGGCSHMTCKNCKSEFCWLCTKCNKHDDIFCIASFGTKMVMAIMLLINILWMLGFMSFLGNVIWMGLKFLSRLFMLNGTAIALYFSLTSAKNQKLKTSFIMAFTAVNLCLLIHYWKMYFSLIFVGLVEVAVLAAVTFYEKKMKIWLYSVY